MIGITNEFTEDGSRSVFAGDNPSGNGEILLQVSFLEGATGSVQLSARLGSGHTALDQGDPITEDTILRLVYGPELLADVAFTDEGTILITVFSA